MGTSIFQQAMRRCFGLSKILVPISHRFGRPWWVPFLGQCTIVSMHFSETMFFQFEQDAPTSSAMTLEGGIDLQ